jgi:ketosteroid isomerase-like protein
VSDATTSAIDLPADALPHIDEHSIEISARPDRVWEGLVATLPGSVGGGRAARGAKILGCEHTEANGEPSVIGSTLPGFVVSRSVRPSTLVLLGQHRFSLYAFAFFIDELPAGRSRLRAETRAEFPGARGRLYKTLVIGSRGHRVLVRRILGAVKRRAEGSGATVDRPQVEAWIARYVELWQTAGTDGLADLFAKNASYSTGPYERPHIGLEAIARMWEAERHSHDERFEMRSEIIAVEGDTGVIRVEVRYGRPREQEYRDLWIVRLDGDGRCVHFEEWPYWPPGTDGETGAGAAHP